MFFIKDFLMNFLKRSKGSVYAFLTIVAGSSISGVQGGELFDSFAALVGRYDYRGEITQVSEVEGLGSSIASAVCDIGKTDLLFIKNLSEDTINDTENTLSAYGKVMKIYNLLKNIEEISKKEGSLTQKSFLDESLSSINETLQRISQNFTTDNGAGNFDEVGNGDTNNTVFGILNYALQQIRGSYNYPFSKMSSDSSELLHRLTQIGSRGFSPGLIKAIQTASGGDDGEKALNVLKSETCWQTIFGPSPDSDGTFATVKKNAAGSLMEQVAFLGDIVPSELNENFGELKECFENIKKSFENIAKAWKEKNPNDETVISVYNLMIPKDPVNLDLLNADTEKTPQEVRIQGDTLQECLACLLSGYCTPGQEGKLLQTAQNQCNNILDLLSPSVKCCREAAQYATLLNSQISQESPSTETLLKVLQKFNEGTFDTSFVFKDFLKGLLSATMGDVPSVSDSTYPNGFCDQLVGQLAELVATLSNRYKNCNIKIDLLTDTDWAKAVKLFKEKTQGLQDVLTGEETEHDNSLIESCKCHQCTGSGACSACKDVKDESTPSQSILEKTLKQLDELAKQLEIDQKKAPIAKSLAQLDSELDSLKTAIERLNTAGNMLDTTQREKIARQLGTFTVSTKSDPWEQAIENLKGLNTILESTAAAPNILCNNLDTFMKNAATRISTALSSIVTALDLIKRQAEPISDINLGRKIEEKLTGAAFTPFKTAWENVLKATNGNVTTDVQTELDKGTTLISESISQLLAEIAQEYNICCKETRNTFKMLLESTEKLIAGLTTWQNRLNNLSTTLPKIGETGWTNLSSKSTLQEAVDETIKAMELTGVTPVTSPVSSTETTPCRQIDDYAQRTVTALGKVPSLLTNMTTAAGSRADAELPLVARTSVIRLAEDLSSKQLPTFSCPAECNHSFDNITPQETLGQLPSLAKKLAESLQPKCCLEDAKALYALAKATDVFAQLTNELDAKKFLGARVHPLKLDDAIDAAKGLVESLPSTVVAHETTDALNQLATRVTDLGEKWKTLFALGNVSTSISQPTFFNCPSKREMIEQLNTSLKALSSYFSNLNTSLSKQKIVSTKKLLALTQALKDSVSTIKNAVPTKSICEECGELPIDSSIGVPLQSVENGLETLIKKLGDHTDCKTLAQTTLNFLTAAIQSTHHIAAHSGVADRKILLDDLLSTLEMISAVDISTAKDTVLADFTLCLSSKLTGGEKVPPYTYMEGDLTKKEVPHKTLVTMVSELTKNFANLESTLQTILQSWDNMPPDYDATTHEKLAQLITHATVFRQRFVMFWNDLAPFSDCDDFDTPKDEDKEAFQAAFDKLDVESLLFAYVHLQNKTSLARAVQFVTPLETLRHALTVCVEAPLYDVTVPFETGNKILNLFQTTRLAPVLAVWQQALDVRASDEVKAQRIQELADAISRFYTDELKGTFPALPPCTQPIDRLLGVRTLLTEHVLAIGNLFMRWTEATLNQPLACQKDIAELLPLTANFLAEQANILFDRQKGEQAALTAPYHREEAAEEADALSSLIEALRNFVSPVADKSDAFLVPFCQDAFAMALESLYRNLEVISNGLSTLAYAMAMAPPATATDPRAVADATTHLESTLSQFLTALAPLPNDVLCAEAPAATDLAPVVEAAIALYGPLQALASTVGITLEETPQELKGIPVEVSLNELGILLQGLPEIFAHFVTYAQKTYDHPYIETTVQAIQRISLALNQAQHALAAFEAKGIVLCRERCETPCRLPPLVEGLQATTGKMDEFYQTLRLRFWGPHQITLRSFRTQVEQHLAFLRVFQVLGPTHTALEDGDTNKLYADLNAVFLTLNDALAGLSVETGDTLETKLAALEAFYETLPYDPALNDAFRTVHQIFFNNSEQPIASAIETQKTNPLDIIHEDFTAILTALQNQGVALQTIDEFPTSGGDSTLQNTLMILAATFGEGGTLRKAFMKVYTTFPELIEDFDTDIAARIPSSEDLNVSFDTLKKEIEKLAKRFDPEQCQRLAEHYADLACELEILAEGLETLENGPEFVKDFIVIVRDNIATPLVNIEPKLERYFNELVQEGTPYCASFVFCPLLRSFLNALQKMNQTHGWIAQAADPFEAQAPCKMLDESHDWFLAALKTVHTALQEKADRIQTFGHTDAWTSEQLEQFDALIMSLTDLLPPLTSLRDALKKRNPSMCSSCTAVEPDETQTFLSALIEEKIEETNDDLLSLKDVLKRLLYGQAFESAWLRILHGVTELAETLEQDESPLERTQTIANEWTHQITLLKDPLAAYLTAAQPDEAHLKASQDLANLLAPEWIPTLPPLPFTKTSWEKDVTATLEQIERFAPAIERTNAALRQTTFFKQPILEQILAELISDLKDFAELCTIAPTAVYPPVVLEDRLKDRSRLQDALEALVEQIEALLGTLRQHTAEQALREKVALTQAVLNVLPRVGTLFEHVIEGKPSTTIAAEREALYQELLRYQPKALSPPTLAKSLTALQVVWQEGLDAEALVAAADQVHAAAFETLVRLLQCTGELADNVPSVEGVVATTIDVSLTKIAQAFLGFYNSLEKSAYFMTDLQFDSEVVLPLIALSSPLQELCLLDDSLEALAKALHENPGIVYGEVIEDALILSSIGNTCFQLQALIQKLRELRDERTYVDSLKPSYRLLLQFQALAAQLNAVIAQPGLENAAAVLKAVATVTPDFPGDSDPDRLIALLQRIAKILESLGVSAITPSSEMNTDVLRSLTKEMIEERIEEAVTAIQTPQVIWVEVWLNETYTLHEDLIQDALTVQASLDGLIYDWTPLQATLQAFADQLERPTCCLQLNQSLNNIYKELSALPPFFKALAELSSLPTLEDPPYEKLCEDITVLTNTLTTITGRLNTFEDEPSCQNSAFINLLTGSANDLNTFNKTLAAIGEILDIWPQTTQTPPLPEIVPCRQTDVLLSRLAPTIHDALEHGTRFLEIVVLRAGESHPYRSKLIETLQTFIEGIESLNTGLNTFSSISLCQQHDPMGGTFTALAGSLYATKAFVQELIDRLDAFKYAKVGELIHSLEAEAATVKQCVAALKDLNIEQVEIATLASIKTAVEGLTITWDEELGNVPSAAPDLISNETTFENLLRSAQQLTNVFQQLTGEKAPDERPIVYGEEQIADDLKRIRDHQTAFKEAIQVTLTSWTIAPRKHKPEAATIVESFQDFFEKLEGARELLANPPTGFKDALENFLPPDSDPSVHLLLHRLAFALKSETCCEEYLKLIDTLVSKYAEATQALDGLVAGTPDTPLSVNAALNEIQTALDALTATLESSTTCLKRIETYIQNIHPTTCFTAEEPAPTNTRMDMETLVENLETATATIARLAIARQSLYVLENSTDGFGQFSAHMAHIRPYYQDEIADKWETVNTAASAQITALKQVVQALAGKPVCFLLDAQNEYGQKLKAFDSLTDLLTQSQAALQHYKARCCARATEALRRVTDRLIPLTALEGVLFRNATIDNAETCCKLIADTLAIVIKQLAKHETLDPHTITTFEHFYTIETQLAALETALKNYGQGLTVPSGEVPAPANDPTFEEQITTLETRIATTLGKTLTNWITTLKAEDGESDNERCYSKAAEPFIVLLNQLKEHFMQREVSSSYQHDPTSINTSLAQIGSAFETLANQAETIDMLLKAPTCCIQRAHIFYDIHLQLDWVTRCIEGALDTFAGPLDAKAFQTAIEAATASLQAVTEDLGVMDYADSSLRCRANLIIAQTATLRTDVTTLANQMKAAMTLLGEPKSAGALLVFTDKQSGCDRLDILDKKVADLFKRVAASLETFAQKVPVLPLTYHAGTVTALKALLGELEKTKIALNAFRLSLGTPCTPCLVVTEEYALDPILKAFQTILEAIQKNRDTTLAKIFHTMTETVRTATVRFEALLRITENGLTRTDLQEIQKGFATLSAPFSQAIQSLKEADDFDISDPQTHTVYQDITTQLQAIDQDLQITLLALGQSADVPAQNPPELFGPNSMRADWTMLGTLLEKVATTFNDQAENPALYHRALDKTWTEIHVTFKTLKETLENRTQLKDWLATSALDNVAQKAADGEGTFLEAVRKMDPCSKLNAPLKQFLPIFKALTQTFSRNPVIFETNLETGIHFQEALGAVTTATNDLTTVLTTTPPTDAVNDPLVAEGLICYFDATYVKQITDAFDLLKGSIVSFARVFAPDFISLTFDPSEKTTRLDLYREMADELTALETAFTNAVSQAQLCPVRDYRTASIFALETFQTALENLIHAVPTAFSLVEVCSYCDGAAEQGILKEMIDPCNRMKENVQKSIDYLKKMCCSRLAFQLFKLADHLSLIQQYLTEQSKKDPASLEAFLVRLAGATSEMPSLITTYKLTDFQALFESPGHCPTAALAFVTAWDEDIICPLLEICKTSTETAATVLHPSLYDCRTIPDAISACISVLPDLNAALSKQLNRLESTAFSYQQMQPLGVFLDTLQIVVDNLIQLGATDSPLRDATFCPYCGELTFYANTFASKEQEFENLKTIFNGLHELFEKYCDHETVVLLHKYNTDLQKVIDALRTVNEDNISEKWQTFLSQGQRALNNLYSAENAGNTALETIIAQASGLPSPAHCLLKTFEDGIETLQTGMTNIATNVIPLVDETFTASYVPLTYGQSSVMEQGHIYLTKLGDLEATIRSILTEATRARLQPSKEISVIFAQLFRAFLNKTNCFSELDEVWAQKLPCPKWGTCNLCENCDACANDPENPPAPHVSCHVLHHISIAMHRFAVVVESFEKSFVQDCCRTPFLVLFPLIKSVSDVGICLETVTKVLRDATNSDTGSLSENLLSGTLQLFSQGMENTQTAIEALVEDHEKAHSTLTAACRMPYMTAAFSKLQEVFQSKKEDEADTGLVIDLLDFLREENIPVLPFQEADKFEFMCGELGAAMSALLKNVQRLSKIFVQLSEAYSKIRVMLTPPDESAMQRLRGIIQTIATSLRALKLRPGQTPLCNTCQENAIQDVLDPIAAALEELAETTTSLTGNCCQTFGESLAKTQEILVSVFMNAAKITQAANGGLGAIAHAEELKTGLRDTLSSFAPLFSSRQILPPPNTERRCVTQDWAQNIDKLNKALQENIHPILNALLATLSLSPWRPTATSNGKGVCDNIAKNFEDVPAALEVFEKQLEKAPQPTTIGITEAHILAEQLKELAELFTHAGSLSSEFAAAENAKHLCPNCNFQKVLAQLTLHFNRTAYILNLKAEELDAIDQTFETTLKEKILNATARLAHWLGGLADIQPLTPYVATLGQPVEGDTPPFSDVSSAAVNCIQEILEKLQCLPVHEGNVRIEDLRAIQRVLENTCSEAKIFLQHALPESQWARLITTVPTPIQIESNSDFEVLLPSAVFHIAESIEIIAENCAYDRVQTDDPSEAGFVEALAKQADVLAKTPQKNEEFQKASFELALATKHLAENLRPDATHLTATLSVAADLIRQIAEALNRSRPTPGSCDIEAYRKAWSQFFEALTPLAEWSVKLAQINASSTTALDTAIEEAFEAAPLKEILEAALQLELATTNTSYPHPALPSHGTALCGLAQSCVLLKEAFVEFATVAKVFHTEQNILVDLQKTLNLTILLPAIQDAWKTLQKQSGVQNATSPSERAVLDTALEQLASISEPISTLLQTTQETLRITQLHTHLDKLTLDERGIPVAATLFQPRHNALGLPQLDTHGNSIAVQESLLTQTGIVAHHAEYLRVQTLGRPTCPDFQPPK